MGNVLYKDHAIVASGKPAGAPDDAIGFTPVAVITWDKPDEQRRVMYILKSKDVYMSVEEASVKALEQAKQWVERHASLPR
jgi:hypothetical protein